MQLYRLSPQAEQDIEAILEWTHSQFGKKARLRYEALLTQAVTDVAEVPERHGGHARPEIAPSVRTYHLRNSRDRVARTFDRVPRPRHFLLHRAVDDGWIEIGRVLHDAVDFGRHLPEEYRADSSGEADPA